MNDRVYRILLLHGLTYLTVAVWIPGSWLIPYFFPTIDEAHGVCLILTAIVSISMLSIWRHYVHWSGMRTSATASLTALMFAQVIIWKPIWSSTKCATEDVLRGGQSISLSGIWCLACSLIWWGGILLARSRAKTSAQIAGRKFMSKEAARLVLAGCMIPLIPGLWLFSMGTMDIFNIFSDDKTEMWLALELPFATAVVLWWLLWRRAVVWNTRVKIKTVALAILFLASAAWYYIPWARNHNATTGFEEFLYHSTQSLPLWGMALWFGGTAIIWRSDKRSRVLTSAVPSSKWVSTCPSCSYDLTGLREVRCPECGWTSTIDDVVRRSIDDWAAASDLTV